MKASTPCPTDEPKLGGVNPQAGFPSDDAEKPGRNPSVLRLPPAALPPGPHRVVELGHQLRVLKVTLTPVHLGALVGEDAGHPEAAPTAHWLGLAERSMRASNSPAQAGQAEDSWLPHGRQADREEKPAEPLPVAPGQPSRAVAAALGISRGAGTVQGGRRWGAWAGSVPPIPTH